MKTRLLYAESAEITALIERADELMNSAGFTAVKAEGKTRAGFLSVPERPVVFIKRTEAKSWLSGFRDLVAGSPASQALRGAKIIRDAGFHCAMPLAAMDAISGAAVRASYLASEALVNAQILSHFALGREGAERKGYARRKTVSDALAAELHRLHDAGVYTRDLQETNIMVEECESGLRFYFLDLEDFRRTSKLSTQRRMLNLVHLDRSIGRFVSRSGRLDFLYAYAGAGLDRDARRKLVSDFLELRRLVDREHGDHRE
jgi:hypothetical protein